MMSEGRLELSDNSIPPSAITSSHFRARFARAPRPNPFCDSLIAVDPNPEADSTVRVRLQIALEVIRSLLRNAFLGVTPGPTTAPSPSQQVTPIVSTSSSDNTMVYVVAGIAALIATLLALCLSICWKRSKKRRKKAELRAEILKLLKVVAPEQVVNFDHMMAQFDGKEEELLEQLQSLKKPKGYNVEVLSPVPDVTNVSVSSSSSGGTIWTTSKRVLASTAGLDVIEFDEERDEDATINLSSLNYVRSSASIDGKDGDDDNASAASSHAWALASQPTTTATKLAEFYEDASSDEDDDSDDSDYVPVSEFVPSTIPQTPTTVAVHDDGEDDDDGDNEDDDDGDIEDDDAKSYDNDDTSVKSGKSVTFAPSPDKSYKNFLPVRVMSSSSAFLTEDSEGGVEVDDRLPGIEAIAEERLKKLKEKDEVIARKDKALRELAAILSDI